MSSVLVGVFENEGAARAAHRKLMSRGFGKSDVTFAGGPDACAETGPQAVDPAAEPSRPGAVARFFRKMFGQSSADPDSTRIPDEEADTYSRRAYGIAVTILDEDDMHAAENIFDEYGAVDIEETHESLPYEWLAGAGPANVSYAAWTGAVGIDGHGVGSTPARPEPMHERVGFAPEPVTPPGRDAPTGSPGAHPEMCPSDPSERPG